MVVLLTESDPRALIRGDAGQVIEVARRVRALADQGLRPLGDRLERQQLQAQRVFWLAQADILDSLATAFERYAVAISAAQASAARAVQAAAWARTAFPYPAAWTAYGLAATELRDAEVRLGEAADVLADAVERATEALPDGESGDCDWQLLGRAGLQVADELAAIVAGGLLTAVGLGGAPAPSTGSPPGPAAALPDPAGRDPATPGGVLTGLLGELDRRSIAYTLARPLGSALQVVVVAVPGQRWEVELTDSGVLAVEVFTSDGTIRDGAALADLWRLTGER